MNPIQVRYQTALRPDVDESSSEARPVRRIRRPATAGGSPVCRYNNGWVATEMPASTPAARYRSHGRELRDPTERGWNPVPVLLKAESPDESEPRHRSLRFPPGVFGCLTSQPSYVRHRTAQHPICTDDIRTRTYMYGYHVRMPKSANWCGLVRSGVVTES